jgi:WD40 repeat protein
MIDEWIDDIFQIKSFAISRRNDYIVTNSQDRVIRCYRLQDMLNTPRPGNTIHPSNQYSAFQTS